MAMSSTPRWTAPHILHLLPQLSALALSSKWMHLLESKMTEDRNITPLGTSLEPSKKALELLGDGPFTSDPWETFQAAVSEEDRSRVAAVLASGPGGVVDVPGLEEGQEWHHLLLWFFMALLPSLPDLHRLNLGMNPAGKAEDALEVFYGALLFHHSTSSLRHLQLSDTYGYGTETSCVHLAHLLRSTHCKLHTLELHDVDSLRAEGIGHIARGLESPNTSTLTQLSITECYQVRDAGVQLLAAMLRTNCTLQKLQLKNIGMGGDGVGHLCDALSQSSASRLSTLDISRNTRIGAQGALHLGNMLTRNPPALRELNVSGCRLLDEEGHLLEGLQGNTTLEELNISRNNLGLDLICFCLAHKSLKKLAIGEAGKMPSARKLAAIISSHGESLLELRISWDNFYSPYDWTTHILPAVARNQVLQILNMKGCRGVDGRGVQTALLDLLRVNTAIQSLELHGTPLHWSGRVAAVEEALRRNKEYAHVLSTMPTSKPRSCRIILCGTEYAGKTTLLNTLQLVYARGPGITHCFQHMKVSGRRLWHSLFPQSDHDKRLGERTRGIDIHLLKDEQDGLRISVWDFAGQREYHALHHFMFPSGNQGAATMFVFAFNPIGIPGHHNAGRVKKQQELKDDFSYWLKFVASNSRPDAPQPQVLVVVTNKDRLARKLQHPQEWLTGAHQTIRTLAHDFRGVVSVRAEPPFIVNALAANDRDIRGWAEYMDKSFRTTLSSLPKAPSICDTVAKASQTAATPIVTNPDFVYICKSNAEDRAVRVLLHTEWKAVAAYLHDAGEVIYHDKLPFIVLNPRWFGHGILGHLIDLSSRDLPSGYGGFRRICTCGSEQQGNKQHFSPQDGYLDRAVLLELLKVALKSVPGLKSSAVKVDDLIQLMLLLNLCYEKKSGDPDSGYFLPAIFYDAQAAKDKRALKWRQPSAPNTIFAGRRLECDDSKRTFLTDGFFPLLQVVLHNYALQEWCTDSDSDIWRLEKNLFTILVNGMEVMVEYSSSRYFVDVLVKSSKSLKETMEFVQSHFIETIREVCARQEGCPGVSLREAIIRPACCGAGRPSPVLCAYRKNDQVIAISELKTRREKFPNYEHSWGEVVNEKGKAEVGAGKDSVALLLGEEDSPSTAELSVMTNDLIMDSHRQHVVVTTEDVTVLHRVAAWARFSRVVPMRLHLQCECREGVHEVDQQPGRTFYLVDNDTWYALEQTTRQAIVLFAASALKMVPGFSGVGSALSSLHLKDGTPVYRDTIESLSTRVSGKASNEVTVEELRSLVEADMQTSREGHWMNAFLNRETVQAFKRDFRLRKVDYDISSSERSSSWICDEHYERDVGMFTAYL